MTIVEEITPVELGIDPIRFPGWRPGQTATDMKTCDVCEKEIPNTGYSKARYLAQRFCSRELVIAVDSNPEYVTIAERRISERCS